MASRNVNDKLKLPIVKNKPINHNVSPNLPVSKIGKKMESIKPSTTKTPVSPVPSTKHNAEKAGKSTNVSTPKKLKPEKPKLPCLDYEHVLKILRLAEAENLQFKQLILLRSLGKAWRLAIDTLHLPFRHKPASLWSPYMSDKVPEDALAMSPGKHFKFPRDIQLFQEMSTHPHNPFPTRELKIWCQAKLPTLEDLSISVYLVADHIWSLTYVVGATVDSIRLLYDLLTKMSHLKDLRVIEAHPDAMDEEQKETILFPQLDLPSSLPPQLSCLSVTGSNNPSILLDTLLEAFGKGSNLKSLEIQGKAAANSEFLQRETYSSSYLLNVQKLKICGADDESLEAVLNEYGWGYYLTHLSIDVQRSDNDNSPILSDRLVSLFELTHQITDLYLYFDNLSGIEWNTNGARGGPPEIRFNSVNSVRRLGLPYFFALWNCWSLFNCWDAEEIEFHDWAATVNKTRRDLNSVKFQEKEKAEIRAIVSRYRRNYGLRKVTVYFGKSAKNSVVFQRWELLADSFHLNW